MVRDARLFGHRGLPAQGRRRFAHLWLTNDDSQKIEAANGSLPTRPAVWEWDIAQAANDPYKKQVLATFQDAAKYAFPVPPTAEWIEISNVVYPELQAAILGDKTPKAALDAAAERRRKSFRTRASSSVVPRGGGETRTRRRRDLELAHRVHRLSCNSMRLGTLSLMIGPSAKAPSRRFRNSVIGSMKSVRISAPFLLLLPAIIVLVATVAAPLVFSLYSSFTAYRLTRPESLWLVIGFRNYANALTDPVFLAAFARTVLLLTIALNLEMLLGLGLALLVERATRGQRLLRTLMMFPMMFSPILVGFQFKFLFNDNVGLVNNALQSLGITDRAIPWLIDGDSPSSRSWSRKSGRRRRCSRSSFSRGCWRCRGSRSKPRRSMAARPGRASAT